MLKIQCEITTISLILFGFIISNILADSLNQDDTEYVRELNLNSLEDPIFYLDHKYDNLFVGGRGHIFKLNLTDITSTNTYQDFDDNDIQIIQPFRKNKLFICGVKNYQSTNWIIHKNFEVSLNDSVNWKSPFSLKCSVARTRKATALMDPNGITLYSGVPRFNKSDYYSPSIFRTNFKLKNKGVLDPIDIQTSQNYKRIWPHGDEDYVGSFYVDHQVLFFFQETGSVDENKKIQIIDEISAETHRGHSDTPGGAETYFRVARVCKKDKGTSKKPRTWSTYAKARLNCSSFETMNSIYKIHKNDKFFYGTFLISNYGDDFSKSFDSGICVFHIDDINRAFDGEFMKIYYKNNALSDPVNIPQARPKLCQENLKNYHNTSGDYSTMDTVIEPLMDGPIFELKNEQSYLTKIVADKISKSVCGNVVDLTVIYAGTSQGEVYKIIQWTEQGKIITKLQDKFQAIPEDEEIKAMEISSKHQSIYVASARRVKQINMKISEDLIKSLFNLKC